MSRISLAFRSFFSILFSGTLPPDVAQEFGYSKAISEKPAAAPQPPKPQAGPKDGAVQILAILQRDSRLVDFLMEDLTPYPDDQVGAAVRDVQSQAKQALERYLRLTPVLDGVEGSFTKTDGVAAAEVKYVGNVPASGQAAGGLLRHKGWRAEKIDLPDSTPGVVLAPAEIEVE